MIRTVIVDDHVVVRDGLRLELQAARDVTVAGEAATAAMGRKQILALRPDVAIVDLRLPDGSGVDVVRAVRSADPRIACLIFTSFPEREWYLRAAVAGASGFLAKYASRQQILTAVRTASAGGSLMDLELLERTKRQMSGAPIDGYPFSELSGQERRILDLVSQGLTNREIGSELGLAEKTVRNYVSDVLGKIGVKNRTQAAAYLTRVMSQRAG